MHFLLKASHWQIAFMQLIPLACIFLLKDFLEPLHRRFMWIILISVAVAWLYTVGSAANEKVADDNRLSVGLHLFSAFATPVIFTVVLLLMYRASVDQTLPPSWLIYLLFSGLACFFFMLWFTARQFVSAEKGEKAYYIEYAFPILGFWFGFVGAWFLQPRVNRVLGESV